MIAVFWFLVILAIGLGFLLGVVLGIRHDFRGEAVGSLIIGTTGEEDDPPHLFLNLDESIADFESEDFVLLRVKRVEAQKKHGA